MGLYEVYGLELNNIMGLELGLHIAKPRGRTSSRKARCFEEYSRMNDTEFPSILTINICHLTLSLCSLCTERRGDNPNLAIA